jgi:hypothetical protein
VKKYRIIGEQVKHTLALSGRRSQGCELLLDDTPGVGGGLGGVELGGDPQLLDVDLRRGLEAVPGRLEDFLFLFGEEGLVSLGWGGLLVWRGRHCCRRWALARVRSVC